MSVKIKLDAKNFNRHTDSGMQLLEKSIGEVGVIESIAVDKKGEIITGNARFETFEKLGYKPRIVELGKMEYPVIQTNLEGEKRVKAAILANTTAQMNINLDMNLMQQVAVEEFDINIEEIGVEEVEDGFRSTGNDDRLGDKEESNEFYNSMITDCIYESNNEFEIPNLLLSGQAGKLMLPCAAWGADSRLRKDVATYHFYVDDYRFDAIWKDPSRVMASGVKAVVEPNCSIYDTTPVAYGLHLIYKKRWIARYWQECGILVYADMNVSSKFMEYNKFGIPKGYNAFFTRGYADRIAYLKIEIEAAKEISGMENPNIIVYGGGGNVRKFCTDNSLVYVEQFMQNRDGKDKR